MSSHLHISSIMHHHHQAHHYRSARDRAPGVVAGVQSEGPVLHVATAAAHAADALGTQLAGSGGATHFLRAADLGDFWGLLGQAGAGKIEVFRAAEVF